MQPIVQLRIATSHHAVHPCTKTVKALMPHYYAPDQLWRCTPDSVKVRVSGDCPLSHDSHRARCARSNIELQVNVWRRFRPDACFGFRYRADHKATLAAVQVRCFFPARHRCSFFRLTASPRRRRIGSLLEFPAIAAELSHESRQYLQHAFGSARLKMHRRRSCRRDKGEDPAGLGSQRRDTSTPTRAAPRLFQRQASPQR